MTSQLLREIALEAGFVKVSADLEEQIGSFSYQINRRKPSPDHQQMMDQPVDDDLVVGTAVAFWWSAGELSSRYSSAKAGREVEIGR